MSDQERGFDFLRVSLGARLKLPAIVAVTSARENDGTSLVAEGLAESFALAGHTTLLVTSASRANVMPMRGDARINLTRMNADQVAADRSATRASFCATFPHLRAHYEIVVVDTEPTSESGFSYEIAAAADGVLVAIRMGRKPSADDRKTVSLLEACQANVLGIVPTKSAVRAAFGRAKSRTAVPEDGSPVLRPGIAEAVRLS